eukprot:351083-Chlamydomonas_euryale.AAC.1
MQLVDKPVGVRQGARLETQAPCGRKWFCSIGLDTWVDKVNERACMRACREGGGDVKDDASAQALLRLAQRLLPCHRRQTSASCPVTAVRPAPPALSP